MNCNQDHFTAQCVTNTQPYFKINTFFQNKLLFVGARLNRNTLFELYYLISCPDIMNTIQSTSGLHNT